MMTDSEIKTYFKWLHPKQDRVGIIAELNGCQKNEIRRILGMEETKPKRKQKTKWDWAVARELYDLGKSDKEISEVLGNGCVTGNVANWRHNHGLECKGPGRGNRQRKAAVVNPDWEKEVADMVQEKCKKAKEFLDSGGFKLEETTLDKVLFPAIAEPDPWELIKQLEQQILFLRGVAIGAGVRNIDELLVECGA